MQEIIRGTLSEVYDDISQRKEIKGEIVALINPKNKGKENERD